MVQDTGEQRVFNLDPFVSDGVDAVGISMGLPEVQLANSRLEAVRIWCLVLVNGVEVIDGIGKNKQANKTRSVYKF